MLTITISDKSRTFDQIFEDNKLALGKEIVTGIADAIDKGASNVTVCQIVSGDMTFYFSASKSYYSSTLQSTINTLVEFEEYEFCALAKQYINKISGKNFEQKFGEDK